MTGIVGKNKGDRGKECLAEVKVRGKRSCRWVSLDGSLLDDSQLSLLGHGSMQPYS